SSSPWTTGAKDIKDLHLSGMWTEAVIENLGSSTDYEFRIVSTNSLGTAQSLPFRVRTLDGLSKSLNGGVIAGIVITVIIFIVVIFIAAILIYRKKTNASRGHEYSEAHPPYDTIVRGGIRDEHEYSVIAKTSLARYSNGGIKDEHHYSELVETSNGHYMNVSTQRDKDNIQDIDNTSTQGKKKTKNFLYFFM
ncbi:neural cell adhesion molecule 1, partial [Biomphalaria glabrata]